MAGLFSGTPQTATSYTTSSTETPKWMQDAIYNQIQWATNVANSPFQPYAMPTVAELSPLQQQAYQRVQQNQGVWQPGMNVAQAGMQSIAQDTDAAQSAAQPYMAQAAQTSAQNVGQYMSPYTQGVLNVIAKQGARNLTENLLPGVSDAFIRAGQFGSGRMGEFGSRALRDTQEGILNQQAQALQAGYGQALGAAQTDLSRQGQLASTAGQLASTDINRQASALNSIASMADQQQRMGTADVAALEAAGTSQQAQMQKQLDAAYQQYAAGQQYPKSQLDWLNAQVRGMAPSVPTTTTGSGGSTGQAYSASPLSQLASGMYTYKGLSSLGQ